MRFPPQAGFGDHERSLLPARERVGAAERQVRLPARQTLDRQGLCRAAAEKTCDQILCAGAGFEGRQQLYLPVPLEPALCLPQRTDNAVPGDALRAAEATAEQQQPKPVQQQPKRQPKKPATKFCVPGQASRVGNNFICQCPSSRRFACRSGQITLCQATPCGQPKQQPKQQQIQQQPKRSSSRRRSRTSNST